MSYIRQTILDLIHIRQTILDLIKEHPGMMFYQVDSRTRDKIPWIRWREVDRGVQWLRRNGLIEYRGAKRDGGGWYAKS